MKVLLCHPMDSMDYSLSGSSLHGILQEKYCSGLPCPSPGDLPNPEIKPRSPSLQENFLPAGPTGKPVQSKVRKRKTNIILMHIVESKRMVQMILFAKQK